MRKLSDIEVKVLKLTHDTMRRKVIREKLSLTHAGVAKIFKDFKELGLTQIIGYGGTPSCMGHYEESCDCDFTPEVGRFTVLTELGKTELRKYVDHSILP